MCGPSSANLPQAAALAFRRGMALKADEVPKPPSRADSMPKREQYASDGEHAAADIRSTAYMSAAEARAVDGAPKDGSLPPKGQAGNGGASLGEFDENGWGDKKKATKGKAEGVVEGVKDTLKESWETMKHGVNNAGQPQVVEEERRTRG